MRREEVGGEAIEKVVDVLKDLEHSPRVKGAGRRKVGQDPKP